MVGTPSSGNVYIMTLLRGARASCEIPLNMLSQSQLAEFLERRTRTTATGPGTCHPKARDLVSFWGGVFFQVIFEGYA
jgi:hypothetical protein